MPIQTFTIDHNLRTKVWRVVRILVCLIATGIVAVIFANQEELQEDGVIYILCGFVVFLVLAAFCLGRGSRMAHVTDISLDEDGIWYSNKTKDIGLVPWDTIEEVREAPTSQRLELIGLAGHEMMRIEYALMGFERLREILVHRATGNTNKGPLEFPMVYSRSFGHLLVILVLVVGAPFLGWAVTVLGDEPLLGYLVMIGGPVIGVASFLCTPYRLTLKVESFELEFPTRKVRVDYRDIESVTIVDTFSKGIRHPSVQVCSKARARPLKLEGFNIDTPGLKSTLMRAALESRERHAR